MYLLLLYNSFKTENKITGSLILLCVRDVVNGVLFDHRLSWKARLALFT